jgi:predicted DNA-binding transcriptional regulator YafY
MPANKPFLTKTLTQPLAVIRRMASPEGTTVNELAECLSLTRRSVFRLIRAIEREFRIPVETKKTFGGSATYHLPQSFVDNLSSIKTPPMELTFGEAVLMYLLTTPDRLPEGNDSEHLAMLRETLRKASEQTQL